MDIFSPVLKNRWVRLVETQDSVKYSFLVRNSLSHLNLDLCEYSNLQNRSRTALEISNDFVNTEEKCRKVFTPSRSLLYTLHLDIPAQREYSLKNDLCTCRFRGDIRIPHIAKVLLSCCFYHQLISNLIDNAVRNTDQTFKILKILLQFPFLKEHIFHVKSFVMNQFIDYFYPSICDPVLFESFITDFNIVEWMGSYEQPDKLQFLLYHVRQFGRELEEEGYFIFNSLDNCVLKCLFSNIKPILMYIDAPEFTLQAYDSYMSQILFLRPEINEDIFTEAQILLPPERICFILQIFWVHFNRSITSGKEALRLLWSSSSDPYICLQEVQSIFVGTLPDEEISDIFEFYCDCIGEIPVDVQPRKLQQLCKTTIRKTLKENFLWIPEGILRMELPNRLRSFLNLE